MLEQLKLFGFCPMRDLVKYSTLQDIVFNTVRGQQMVLSEQLSYDLSDYSIFVAKHVMEEFTHYYGSKRGLRKIIYPGLKYTKTADDSLVTKFGNNFFYTGRLFFLKGPQYSLEAFRKYLEYGKNKSELHIYGEGPLMHRLKIAFKDYIPQKIKFLGMIERDRYLKRIPLYKAMIFPSLYEGCPISMIEALSEGVLVVSFNTRWIREFKDIFNNLFVVRIYDVEKLATSLIDISAMNNVKRTKNIPSDFKGEKFVEKVKKVYLEFIR
jgi:glycosyltransferase involved in cell wall biosynthesis